MTSAPLDYASLQRPRSRRRLPLRRIGIVVGILIVASVIPAVPLRQIESLIDPVTGSMTSKTTWLWVFPSPTRTDVSPLETRLISSGIKWTRSWHFLHNTQRNIFGKAMRYECGSTPPIYQIRCVLSDCAAASTDAELKAFVKSIESGTEAEQQAAVDAAGERGLRFTPTGRL